MNALTCPVCKGVTTSSEKCSSCGLDMRSCLACGGLNPASNQVCLVCGEKVVTRLPLDARDAMNTPQKGAEVPDNWKAGRPLEPKLVRNLTTTLAWVGVVLFAFVLLAIGINFVLSVFGLPDWTKEVATALVAIALGRWLLRRRSQKAVALPAAVEVQNRTPQAFSEVQEVQAVQQVQEVQANPPPLAVASGVGPPFTGRKGAVTGVARGCQVRQETADAKTTWQILTFRLDRFDEAGRPLPSVSVEMRGTRLKGYINDGEWVEVPGDLEAEGLLEPKRVRNLTTASWVEVSPSYAWVGALLGVLMVLGFVILFMNFVASMPRGFR